MFSALWHSTWLETDPSLRYLTTFLRLRHRPLSHHYTWHHCTHTNIMVTPKDCKTFNICFVVTDISPLCPRRRLLNNWQAPAPAAATFSRRHAPAPAWLRRDSAAPALASGVNHRVTIPQPACLGAKLENTCLVVGLESNPVLLCSVCRNKSLSWIPRCINNYFWFLRVKWQKQEED